MRYKHITDKDKACYYFNALRNPQKKLAMLSDTLHDAVNFRKTLKRNLNEARVRMADTTNYKVVLKYIHTIEVAHSQLIYYYEVISWLKSEYVSLIKAHPELRT